MKLRVLFLLLLAGSVVVAGAAVATSSARIARAVEERLEAETGRPWTVAGGASLTLWPHFAIVVRDVGTRTAFADGSEARLDIAALRATGAPLDLLAGRGVREVEVERPSLRWPAEWWRAGGPPAPAQDTARPPAGPRPDLIRVTDGSLALVEGAKVVASVEGVTAEARAAASGYAVKARGRPGGATCEIAAAAGEAGMVPLDFTCRLPQVAAPLTGRADAGVHGLELTLSRLTGSLGATRFAGAALVDLTAKPFVRLDLGFEQLDLPPLRTEAGAADLALLRSFDGRAKLRAGTLRAAGLSASDVVVEAKLTGGTIEANLAPTALHGGQIRATLTSVLAAPGAVPSRHALRLDLTQVRSLPLLTASAGFGLLDGTAGVSLDLTAAGATTAEITRSLSGEAAVTLENGRLNGIDIPGVVQSIATQLSADPRLRASDATAFDRITARLRIADGQATTQDIALAGPLVTARGAGSIDLASRTLALRIEPKLTRSAARALPKLLDISLPVLITGSWEAPQVSVDLGSVLSGQNLSGLGALGSSLMEGGDASPLGGMLDQIFPGAGRPRAPGPGRPGPRRNAAPP
ncbi:AsmA family protein [Methylobacterium oryzisoli]|uniref:AsmA family protein n=1 Tax=Methylobacterium oryzisoli TaxID=3385502 RepID=UPI003891C590